MDDLVNHFLQRKATYDIIALASLMDKNMNNTAGYLNSTLPIDLTSRVMTSMIVADGTNCVYYFTSATASVASTNAICTDYDFTNPYDV